MNVAVIGMGRMGAGVAERLVKGGNAVTVYNRSIEKTVPLQEQGAQVAQSLQQVVEMLPAPRVVWLYLPSGTVTDEHITELAGLLQAGDIVMDGGNSQYTDSVRRSEMLQEKGIHFLDVGTSGGTAGRTEGYCLMIGGPQAAYAMVEPLFSSVAQPGAFRYVGPSGAGHYVKMVHNAIEYGMMQAYGEGFELLEDGQYSGQLDLAAVSDLWQHGSIIRSYLGELLASAFQEDVKLESIAAEIDDSGEGQWTIQAALEEKIPVPVMTAALFARYASKRPEAFTYKVVSVLRKKFGGHAIKTK